MTRFRSAVALFVLSTFVAAPSFAQPDPAATEDLAADEGVDEVDEAVAVAVDVPAVPGAVSIPAANAPDASAPKPEQRSWLAQSGSTSAAGTEATTASSGSSPLGTLAALVVLAALVGGVLYLRRKRQGAEPARERVRIEVLGAARVGPKAQAVVTSVGGRLLLLGVTESSVRRLAWLDAPDSAADVPTVEDPFEEDDVPHASLAVRPAYVPVPPVPVVEPPRRSFRDVLSSVLGRTPEPAAPTAAEVVALETRDVVSTKRRGRSAAPRETLAEVIDIEQQAAGLAARLAERRATASRRGQK